MASLFHVQIRVGWGVKRSAFVYDLDEAELRERFLDPRAQGVPVWVSGEEFDWRETKIEIYEGLPMRQAVGPHVPEDFAWLPLTAEASNVTDRYVTGPPGGQAHGRALAPGSEGAIFLIHGSDHGRLEQVARFLEAIADRDVVILHEQPSRGQTLIEKLEASAANVGHAVVLLTADDLGRQKGSPDDRPRGRQNVILELGLFFGLLGRQHVTVLYEEGIELPSDLHGLVYVPFDIRGSWRIELARELRSSGVPADLNAVA